MNLRNPSIVHCEAIDSQALTVRIVPMATVAIRKAVPADESAIAALMADLWPDGSVEEHRRDAGEPIRAGTYGTLPAAVFVATDEQGSLVGFLQAGLRSHADGCDPAQPVGFIEGWYVREEFRGQGVGGRLVQAAEDWSRAQGSREMASDALLDNEESLRAHSALGFEVIDRCVHFRKKL